MARPRKRENQGLPQNLICRKRQRKNGKIVTYYYYVMSDKKEKPLGMDKYLAVLETARLNCDVVKIREKVITFVTVAIRYQNEVIPLKALNTQRANRVNLKNLLAFFGNPPAPLDKIEPQHIKQYLDWRKNYTASANNEIALFHHIWMKAREWGYTRFPCPSEGIQRYKVKFREIYIEDRILEKIYYFADQQLRDLIDVAYLTGQRPIDIVSIEKKQIIDDELYIVQKKTKKRMRIAVVGQLKEIFNRRLSEDREYLFCNKRGAKLSRSALSNWFAKIREKAAKHFQEYADEILAVQFRDLRAKAGTDKFLSSDTETAQKQLGHTSPQMTKRYIRKDKIILPTKV
ncbi:tyrosine-type recombinase/integrase [Rodentibacter pneumotropicus]|uniref:Integrase n=1 Tax=Rodentibacter pneumotropicus TaxID=758 RepID=A0A4S2P8V2_9PAST|nr:tyrosine-type recombinase/integrase [Rodentibacter pneumotropicus]TGZ99477.1 integrase [Rodentibacter pneumotropicus]TGZ99993.1 integrase [Rodentibacter pneumotropicus]THA09075.1 integrase [Rodentibacter pneumotropicus]THA16102.1 integrase [Rodentibacter pneumotropicus]